MLTFAHQETTEITRSITVSQARGQQLLTALYRRINRPYSLPYWRRFRVLNEGADPRFPLGYATHQLTVNPTTNGFFFGHVAASRWSASWISTPSGVLIRIIIHHQIRLYEKTEHVYNVNPT